MRDPEKAYELAMEASDHYWNKDDEPEEGEYCPECGSPKFRTVDHGFDMGVSWWDMKCRSCGHVEKFTETDDDENGSFKLDEGLREGDAGAVATSGSIEGAVPENSRKTIELRLQERLWRNEVVANALREKDTEAIEKDLTPGVRYQLQQFTNGGEDYDPETNQVKFSDKEDEPSAYEKWRREKVDAGRKARIETQKKDQEREAISQGETSEWAWERRGGVSNLDNQIDQFLADYIEERRDPKKLKESINDQGETTLFVVSKPTELGEVYRAAKNGRNRTSAEAPETRIQGVEFFDKFYDGPIWGINIEPTKGWVKFECDDEITPPFYIDSQGYDYPRYMAIALEDIDEWADIFDYE